MKKNTLIALFAILTLALGGCSEKAEPAADTTTTAETTTAEETTSAEETTEEAVATEEITEEVTTEAATTVAPETITEEVATTSELIAEEKNYFSECESLDEANRIIEDLIAELRGYVENDDFDAFAKMYNSEVSADIISAEWDFYKEYFCNSEKYYETDARATAYTKNEIGYDIFFYWNYTDPNNKYTTENSTKGTAGLAIIYDYNDSAWKFHVGSVSDALLNNAKNYFNEIYGENAWFNGFCGSDYQLKHRRSLLVGINCNVFTAVINNDGSMTVVLGIQNGFNETRYVNITKYLINFGTSKETAVPVIDLLNTHYSDENIHNIKLAANSVKYITIIVPKESLINEIDKSKLKHCSIDYSQSNSNIPYEEASSPANNIPVVTTVVSTERPATEAEIIITTEKEKTVTSSGTVSQTVMGGKVKVTAEKKSNNTIVLTIENNFEKEVSTFGYPQIKVNGMTQDLDKHLQLQNGTQSLSVPAGEKGQITYYVSDVNSVEALIGSLHSMAPSVKDKDFKLVF